MTSLSIQTRDLHNTVERCSFTWTLLVPEERYTLVQSPPQECGIPLRFGVRVIPTATRRRLGGGGSGHGDDDDDTGATDDGDDDDGAPTGTAPSEGDAVVFYIVPGEQEVPEARGGTPEETPVIVDAHVLVDEVSLIFVRRWWNRQDTDRHGRYHAYRWTLCSYADLPNLLRAPAAAASPSLTDGRPSRPLQLTIDMVVRLGWLAEADDKDHKLHRHREDLTRRLLEAPAMEYCDVELVCAEGRRLPAHRAVLCAASAFFRALLRSPMRAVATTGGDWSGSGRAEEKNRERAEVTLEDVPAELAEVALQLIYGVPPSMAPEYGVERWCELYRLADRLDLPEVRSWCANRLDNILSADTFVPIVVLAEHHSDRGLLRACRAWLQGRGGESSARLHRVVSSAAFCRLERTEMAAVLSCFRGDLRLPSPKSPPAVPTTEKPIGV